MALVATLAAASASAQVRQLAPDYKVVERGRSIKLDAFGTYDPDCRSVGRTTVNLTSAPQGGTVETAEGRDHPKFNSNNVRFRCDARRSCSSVCHAVADTRQLKSASLSRGLH